MPVDEYKAMRGLDGTTEQDAAGLYEHFRDEIMPAKGWGWPDVALLLEDRLNGPRRHRLNRQQRTVFGLLLEKVKRNLNVNELLNERKEQ